MANKYSDEKLLEKDFLKLHPQYLPFIGMNYKDFYILQVGESHYIEQKEDDTNEEFGIDYFMNNWWNSDCNELLRKNPWEYDTRKVIDGFLNDNDSLNENKNGKFYLIFQSFSKAFCRGYLNNLNPSREEKVNAWNNLAFTDLFMMPSLYKGKNIEYSIRKSSKRAGKTRKEIKDLINIVEKNSVEVLDYIIDTINPKIIIFTSSRASKAYQRQNGKYSKESYVYYMNHPSSFGFSSNSNYGLPKIEYILKCYKSNL